MVHSTPGRSAPTTRSERASSASRYWWAAGSGSGRGNGSDLFSEAFAAAAAAAAVSAALAPQSLPCRRSRQLACRADETQSGRCRRGAGGRGARMRERERRIAGVVVAVRCGAVGFEVGLSTWLIAPPQESPRYLFYGYGTAIILYDCPPTAIKMIPSLPGAIVYAPLPPL